MRFEIEMPQQYDNEMRWIAFVNPADGKKPVLKGTLTLGGVEYELAGWWREGKKGKFLSGTVKVKGAPAPKKDRDSDVPW